MNSNADDTGEVSGRRDFLKSVGTSAAGCGLASVLAERDVVQAVSAAPVDESAVFATRSDRAPDEVFPQSVASGGPTPSGAIVWTRIAPEAHVPGVRLGVEVARDRAFDQVVHRGTVDPDAIDPAHDYTVKVDLDGELDANEFYFYRFTYDGTRSRTGRCRTLPSADGNPDELAFGVVTCQDYQNGYYPAYHHLAGEDVDFLVHLGDFVYESAEGQYLSPTAEIKPGRDFELPSDSPLAETLDDFRHLYKTYRSDRFLQEALERHTLIAAWDDHEVANDRYWDYATDSPVLPPHGEGDEHDPEFALSLAANGIQSWVEYMPARVEYDPDAEHLHDQFQLWRSFEFGDLLTLVVTDERLYRNAPPCSNFSVCEREPSPDRTLLGERQKRWFLDRMASSGGIWQVWANEVLTVPLTLGVGEDPIELLHDSWDGYRYERDQIYEALAGTTDNLVTLTGDLHTGMACYQQREYPPGFGDEDDLRFGVEFMTPSLTSVNTADVVDSVGNWGNDLFTGLITMMNEHVEFANWSIHGYSVVRFGREECRSTIYTVDKDVDSADTSRSKLVEFRVPEGKVEIQKVPRPAIEAGTTRTVPGEPVSLDATDSRDEDGYVEQYEWAFGDGDTDTGRTTSHAYDGPGTYDVTLTVTDDDGATESATQRIVVVEDDTSACGPETATTSERGSIDSNYGADRYEYATETAAPCSVEVRLDGDGSADLDLYLTLDGRRPTVVDHDRRSWTDGGDERITLAEEELDADTDLGVLVKSYEGTGSYELEITEHGGDDG